MFLAIFVFFYSVFLQDSYFNFPPRNFIKIHIHTYTHAYTSIYTHTHKYTHTHTHTHMHTHTQSQSLFTHPHRTPHYPPIRTDPPGHLWEVLLLKLFELKRAYTQPMKIALSITITSMFVVLPHIRLKNIFKYSFLLRSIFLSFPLSIFLLFFYSFYNAPFQPLFNLFSVVFFDKMITHR